MFRKATAGIIASKTRVDDFRSVPCDDMVGLVHSPAESASSRVSGKDVLDFLQLTRQTSFVDVRDFKSSSLIGSWPVIVNAAHAGSLAD